MTAPDLVIIDIDAAMTKLFSALAILQHQVTPGSDTRSGGLLPGNGSQFAKGLDPLGGGENHLASMTPRRAP